MRLLLDTHVWLWWLADARLERDVEAALRDPDTEVLVSAASVWEISIKRALGKLEIREGIEGELTDDGFEPLAIDIAHASVAGGLPHHHRDPFDRMLVAQAQVERLTLVTRDERLRAYDVPIILA